VHAELSWRKILQRRAWEEEVPVPWLKWPAAGEGFIASFYGHWNRASARFGLEMRDPFLDRRLLEFMFSVPPELLVRDGYSKAIVREAMTGILPELVRTRPSKAEFTPFIDRGLRELGGDELRRILAGELAGARFFRGEVLIEWARRYLEGEAMPIWQFWYALSLELWLRRFWVFRDESGSAPGPALQGRDGDDRARPGVGIDPSPAPEEPTDRDRDKPLDSPGGLA
jgi:asparagine synthetase B (glutamine-hydrolysing)